MARLRSGFEASERLQGGTLQANVATKIWPRQEQPWDKLDHYRKPTMHCYASVWRRELDSDRKVRIGEQKAVAAAKKIGSQTKQPNDGGWLVANGWFRTANIATSMVRCLAEVSQIFGLTVLLRSRFVWMTKVSDSSANALLRLV